MSGTALPGSDYIEKEGVLNFSAADNPEILIIDDIDLEAEEYFYIKLESLTPGVTLTNDTIVAYIRDNDDKPSIGILAGDGQFREDCREIIVNIGYGEYIYGVPVPANFSKAPVTINFYTTIDPNFWYEGATPGEDYVTQSGQVTLSPEQPIATLRIPVIDDDQIENIEHFVIQLEPSDQYYFYRERSNTYICIVDNDLAKPMVQLSSASLSFNEKCGNAIIPVIRSGTLDNPLTVEYNFQDGTATSGNDYSGLQGAVTFPAGQAAASIVVPVLNDAGYEADEFFTVSLLDSNNYSIGVYKSSVLQITDDANIVIKSSCNNSVYNAKKKCPISISGTFEGPVNKIKVIIDRFGTQKEIGDARISTGTFSYNWNIEPFLKARDYKGQYTIILVGTDDGNNVLCSSESVIFIDRTGGR
jgi:hypothetical protein